ncbi:unnamed protein product, partial [Timema podura]|nr:unnamed protein product [Timema podura]
MTLSSKVMLILRLMDVVFGLLVERSQLWTREYTLSRQVPFVYNTEMSEIEDREVLRQIKTRFIPPRQRFLYFVTKRDTNRLEQKV